MSVEQVFTLLAQAPDEGYTAAEIANELNVSKKAVGVYLTTLRNEGLVNRRPGTALQPATWSVPDSEIDLVDTAGSELNEFEIE
ncbi:MAG: ArsR family transcriptional regulator [Halobacteriaceae archaeon]